MGGGKGGNTTTSEFKPPAEFMKAYKEALGMAREATGKPYEQYSGNLVAGLSPSQMQGIANVNAAQGMALPAIQQGMQYTQQAAQGVTPELYNRFYSPYVKDVANTTFANLMESQAQQQSNLKGGAIQAGAFGGDRGGIAQAEMARQQQLANAMSMSNIYNQGYGQAMGLAGQQVANLGAMGQQLAGLGAGAQASVLQGAQAQMAAGAQQQATEQARLQAAYEQWMQRQSYPYQQAQFFANIAQGLGAGAGGSSSTTAPAPNMFSQIFGGLGAIGSIFSDERMKENIKAVGTLNDGQTIYRYNFKGDPKTQIGLLAQEVESRKPGAVTDVKGLKMVNYKEATDDAASMGGVVGPSGSRQALAEGGVPFYPYANARTYVPEGKFSARGSTIPDAPKPFEDEGLAKDWKDIMPLSKEQVSGLRKLASDVGIDLPEQGSLANLFKRDKGVGPTEAETAWISKTNPDAGLFQTTLASGGVVGRHRYAYGGSMMDQAIDEAAGLGAAPEPDVDPALVRMESGGDFGARNAQGYVGRMQFGPDRLTDAKRAGIIPADMTAEEFRRNPDAQKATEAWHFSDINNFIDKTGLAGIEGKAIKGVPVTRAGLVNVAHLGGKGGLEKFVASGGRYDPADANGTRLSDYLALAAKSGGVSDAGPVPSSAGSDGLGGAQNDPPEFVIPGEKPSSGLKFNPTKLFASEENPSVIERIMGRRLSPEARSAVMNASFALMAGRSPFFFTNLGEAGKVGTQTYYNALKQGADITRQAYEAQTGRQQVEVQEAGQRRQLAAFIVPLIQTFTATGQQVPPQLLRILDDAYPPGTEERQGIDAQIQRGGPAAGNVAPVIQSGSPAPSPITSGAPSEPGAAPPPSGEMPDATGQETISQPGPSSGDDLAKIYQNVPDSLNPYKWDQRAATADAAGKPDIAQGYREKAAEIRKADYDRGYIVVPGTGRVPYPYKMEQTQAEETLKLQTAGAYEATKEQTERAQRTIQGYQTAQSTLNQAADTLATTPTGQFADTKAYLITSLYSLGLGADAERLNDAQGTQELNKIFSQILFSGGLKDKIGSQIAASELQMFSRGFGDVSLEPSVNRFIVGTMRGILEMEKKRAQDWIDETDRLGGKTIPRRQIVDWEIKWNEQNPLSKFIEKSIASTPAAGEIDWNRWQNDEGYRKKIKFKPGYQYVMPAEDIKVYTGSPDDKYFLTPEQYEEKYGGE